MSDKDVIARRHIALEQAFAELYFQSGSPKHAGMFTSTGVGPPHVFYFSPGAVRIATALIAAWSGVEIAAPGRSEVNILVANSGLRQIPFRRESSSDN